MRESLIRLPSYCPLLANHILSGGKRTRTADFLRARQALYQLSYTPISRITGFSHLTERE